MNSVEKRDWHSATKRWLMLLLSTTLVAGYAVALRFGVWQETIDLEPARIVASGGHAYAFELEPASVPPPLLGRQSDDNERPRRSRLEFFENGVAIGTPHSVHEEIRIAGRGRFSHWGSALAATSRDWIIFSTTDNSDPRSNGRSYRVRYPLELGSFGLGATTLLWIVSLAVVLWAVRSNNPRVVAVTREAALTFVSRAAHGSLYRNLLLLVALLIFSLELLTFFERPVNSTRPELSATAPYSDALEPWLKGGLHYLFDVPEMTYLYRPTVGLFWGAIIAATDRIWLIPQVLAAALIALLAGMLWLLRSDRLGLTLALFLLLLSAAAQLSFSPLLINTLYVDFAALVFTLGGTWLLIASSTQRGWIGALTAAMLLGIAAAIRGPMMLGAPVLIVLVLGWSARRSWRLWTACLVAFLVVIAADVILQRVHRAANNGIESLYCFATDATRSWSPECSVRYNKLRPDPKDVLSQYLKTVATVDGLESIVRGAERRVVTDIKVFELPFAKLAIGVSMALVCVLWLARRSPYSRESTRTHSLQIENASTGLWPGFAVLALVGLIWGSNHLGAYESPAAVAFVGGLFVIAVASGERLAASSIAAYIACVLFLALIGFAAGHPRLAGTFSFLISLAVSLLLIPKDVLRSESVNRARELRGLALIVLVGLSFLYLGSRVWPSDLRRTYVDSVKGQQAALKLSYDPLSDRALYITGTGGLIYTRADSVTIGGVRRYSDIKYPDRVGNVSFLQPNEFID